jgi:amino acid transporter
MTVINVAGIRESAIITNVFTIGKLLPLLIFAVAGLFFIDPANFRFGQSPEYGRFSEAVLLLIYAYVGFEAAVIPAGETKNPQKDLPFALLTALAVCTVLYILIQVAAIGILRDIANSERPIADAAASFMGSFGAAFIAVGALISILGNLNGGFLAATRLPFAMAEEQELPKVFARTHLRFKTPYVSILLTALVTLVLTLQSTFFSAVTIATITRLLVYATTCMALPVFRRRSDVPNARFLAPFGTVAAILSLGLIIWLLTNVKFEVEGWPIAIAALVGLLIYFGYFIYLRSAGREPTDDETGNV